MNRKRIHDVATLLIAFFLFAQGSVALAACGMDRGSLAPAMEMSADMEGDCATMHAADSPDVTCFVHCTADLRIPGGAAVIVRAPADCAVLHVAAFHDSSIRLSPPQAPPPRGVPPRILLHSYLI